MAGINDTLFGPLGEKYCFLFYLLSVVGFVLLALTVVSGLFLVFTSKGNKLQLLLGTLWLAIVYGFLYLQNRLLYSICEKSL